MTDDDLFAYVMQATAERPLAGMTVLVVEDSRFACEAMRLLCLRSGARIRRADSLRSARRHLSLYRPSAVIVDLGLPDGDGCELIRELARAHPKVDVILGLSGDPEPREAAMEAGADGFLTKPILSLDVFQNAILSRLPKNPMPRGPRSLGGETVRPDHAAFQDDLAHAAEMLSTLPDDGRLNYATQFLEQLAVQAGDFPLQHAADRLRQARRSGRPYGPDLARLAGLVQQRLEGRQAM
jgi:DNA-binding response OmpR family regulator